MTSIGSRLGAIINLFILCLSVFIFFFPLLRHPSAPAQAVFHHSCRVPFKALSARLRLSHSKSTHLILFFYLRRALRSPAKLPTTFACLRYRRPRKSQGSGSNSERKYLCFFFSWALNERCAVTLVFKPLTYSSVRTSCRPWLHCTTLVQPAPEL